jgi:hypothetical protein
MTNRTVLWANRLRWLSVLPASIGAYFVIQFIIGVGDVFLGEHPFFGDFWCQFINSLAGPACFVYAGTMTAPRHRFPVALILTSSHATFTVCTLAFVIIGMPHSLASLIWLIFCSVSGIIATLVVCVVIYGEKTKNEMMTTQDSSETPDLPRKKHPAEDFYRETRAERASSLADMPPMISMPPSGIKKSPLKKRQQSPTSDETTKTD